MASTPETEPASELHAIVKRARNLAPLTKTRYLRDLSQWIEFAGADPIGWTRSRTQEFYNHLIDNRKLRAQSANRVLASVKFASKWRANFMDQPDFATGIQQDVPREFDEKRALTREEVTTLLVSLLDKRDPAVMRDVAMVVVLLETGMRKLSLRSMTIERTLIDVELYSKPHGYPLAWAISKGSGQTEVAIPLSDVAVAAILPWRHWLASRGIVKGPLFRGLVEKLGPRGLLVTVSKTALHLDAVNKLIARRAVAAGIGHVYPHQFRHTFVTWRAAAGLAAHEIASITGHAFSGISGLAVIGGYIDQTVIARKVRNSTPDWLRDLVTDYTLLK